MTSLLVAISMEHVLEHPPNADYRCPEGPTHLSGPPLMPRIAAGDATAVEQFVERYSGLIWTITKKMTRNSHDAEDVVQEIFIDLWKSAPMFRPERGSEVSFIAVIARRRLVDRLRRNNSKIQVRNLEESPVMDLVDNGNDPVEVADEIAKVRNCMEQLTASTQSVLKLILQEGMSHQEVSSSLQLPLGSVKSFARRGLLTLRDCVKRSFIATFQETES